MNASQRYPNILYPGPFFQDVATFYTLLDVVNDEKVLTLASTLDGAVFAGTSAGLVRLDPDTAGWTSIPEVAGPVLCLCASPAGGLWLTTMHELCHLSPDSPVRTRRPLPEAPVSLAVHPARRAEAWVLTRRFLMDSSGSEPSALPEAATGLALTLLADGTPIVATDNALLAYRSGGPAPLADGRPDTGASPADVYDLVADPYGGLWIAHDQGISYYTAGVWRDVSCKDGLPLRETRRLALGSDGALWACGSQGLARLLDGQWRFYAGHRWLPDNHVYAITLAAGQSSHGNTLPSSSLLPPSSFLLPPSSVWAATEGGVARIAFEPMEFARKAAHYEAITAARHNRDGFVTDCRLERTGDVDSFLYEASDNDGLWTSLYAAAESFRYAVTRDPEARFLAEKSLNALRTLVEVTGIPGFPARALIRKGERVYQSDPGPNWYASPGNPDILYKDDTSSDELDGHYLAWYVYCEMVAEAHERQQIAAVCRAVTDHILDHDYTLVGPTGKPTRWGVWTPEALNHDPAWAAERGLNSLEMLSHLKVASHLCGDARFEAAYRTLIETHHYALNTIGQKRTPPAADNNHSDDELAACAYYPLLQLETDPHLRRIYLLSLERTHTMLRPERSPFYNVIYGACTGLPCDAEAAVQWLRDSPWDLRDWEMRNDGRADVTPDPEPGRFGEAQITRALPPNETRVAKWNANPYAANAGGNGSREEDGAFWLLPYWMGRYHGIIGKDEG